MNDETVGFEFDNVLTLHETEKAVLCNIDGSDVWVPKSQILADSEVQGMGDQGILIVTEWWAVKNNLREKGENK